MPDEVQEAILRVESEQQAVGGASRFVLVSF